MFALILVEILSLTFLTVALCVPLAQGSVEMNSVYGIRLREAFQRKENWYAINKYGGKVFIAWSVGMCVVFVPLAIVFKNNPAVLLQLTWIPLLFVVAALIQTKIYASKLP